MVSQPWIQLSAADSTSTNTAQPYCYSFIVPELTMGFYSCADYTSSGFDTFATTSDGAKTPRVWAPIYASAASSGVSLPQSLHTNQAMISYLIRTVTLGSGSSSSSAANSATSTAASVAQASKGSSIGPIAGGVGGGIAAVALIGIVFMLCTRRKRGPAAGPPGGGALPTAEQMAAVAADRPRYSFQDDFPVAPGSRDGKGSFADTRSLGGSDAGYGASGSVVSLSPPLHVADLCNDSVSSMHSTRSTRPSSQHRSKASPLQQHPSPLVHHPSPLQHHPTPSATSGVIPVGISELPERTSKDVSAALGLPAPPPIGTQFANRNSEVLELSSMECKTPMVQVAVPLVLATATPVELDGTAIARPDRSRDGSRQPSRQASRTASRERKSLVAAVQQATQQAARQSVQQPPPQSARQSVQQPVYSARQSVQQPAQSARQSIQQAVQPSARQSMQQPVRQSVQQSTRQSVQRSARQSVQQSARQSMPS
jgi:hypothetical protein